jgi:hypothetical protein
MSQQKKQNKLLSNHMNKETEDKVARVHRYLSMCPLDYAK